MENGHQFPESRFRLKGLVAAVFTPFTANGDLNLPIIDSYVDQLVSDGVRNVFVCGTTGEGMSLTTEERMKVTEKWIESGKDKLDAVVVHVGSSNLRESQKLAQHAQDVGAAAIASIPPVFYKAATIDHLVSFFKEISEAAPKIPFYYYHNPGITGVKFQLEDFLSALGRNPVPSFCGVKFCSTDLYDYGRSMVVCNNHIQIMYAVDEQALPSLTLGGDAFIGSTYNYAGRVSNRMIKFYNAGDMEGAKTEQFRNQAVVNVLMKYGGNVGTNKAMMRLARLDLGPPRAPVHTPSQEELKNMKQDLESIGFFKWNNE
ncbi:N-acetylneuraminate lyase-like [Amphiura filiformis]|uniref:N-acetylneuraminate lyase-like n=1 Tax=Amphiura filiformis TaxID=82378 RepID=UPI003B21CE46